MFEIRNVSTTTNSRSLTNGAPLTTLLALGLCSGVLGRNAVNVMTSTMVRNLNSVTWSFPVLVLVGTLFVLSRMMVLVLGAYGLRWGLMRCLAIMVVMNVRTSDDVITKKQPVMTATGGELVRVFVLPVTLATTVLTGASETPITKTVVMLVNLDVRLVSGRCLMSVNVVVVSGTRTRQLVLEVIDEMMLIRTRTQANVYPGVVFISPWTSEFSRLDLLVMLVFTTVTNAMVTMLKLVKPSMNAEKTNWTFLTETRSPTGTIRLMTA